MVRQRTFYGLLTGLALLSATAQAELNDARDSVEKGNTYYRMGLFEEAGRQYIRAEKLAGETPIICYNLGNVYHQKLLETKVGDMPSLNEADADWLDKAIAAYRQALHSDSPTLCAQALYNLGNTYAAVGKINEAILSYQEALRILPDDADTKHNLELMLKKYKAREAPQPLAQEKTDKPSAGRNGPLINPGATNGVGKAQALIPGLGGGAGGSESNPQTSGQAAGLGAAQSAAGEGWGIGEGAWAGALNELGPKHPKADKDKLATAGDGSRGGGQGAATGKDDKDLKKHAATGAAGSDSTGAQSGLDAAPPKPGATAGSDRVSGATARTLDRAWKLEDKGRSSQDEKDYPVAPAPQQDW